MMQEGERVFVKFLNWLHRSWQQQSAHRQTPLTSWRRREWFKAKRPKDRCSRIPERQDSVANTNTLDQLPKCRCANIKWRSKEKPDWAAPLQLYAPPERCSELAAKLNLAWVDPFRLTPDSIWRAMTVEKQPFSRATPNPNLSGRRLLSQSTHGIPQPPNQQTEPKTKTGPNYIVTETKACTISNHAATVQPPNTSWTKALTFRIQHPSICTKHKIQTL